MTVSALWCALFAGGPALLAVRIVRTRRPTGPIARRLTIAGLLLPAAVVLAAIAVLLAAKLAGSLPTSP
jgi:hypothetical protein